MNTDLVCFLLVFTLFSNNIYLWLKNIVTNTISQANLLNYLYFLRITMNVL